MIPSGRLTQFFDRKAESFDAIYSGRKRLLPRVWDRLTRRNIHDRFAFAMRVGEPWTGKRVLDVGCGSGRYPVEIAKRGASQVIGLDLSERMLTLARGLADECGVAGGCRFLQQDVQGFDDPEGFDVVLAIGFFDYVLDPASMLEQLARLTRSHLIATFPTRGAFRCLFRRAWLKLHGCSIRFYSAPEVQRLLEQAGFTCDTLVRMGPIYSVVARSAASIQR